MSLDKLRMVFGELITMAKWTRQGDNFNESGTMELAFADEDKRDLPTISMQYLAADDSLLVCSETGPLPASLEAQVLRKLMERQYLFQNYPGITCAMGPDSLALTARIKVAVETLTPTELGRILMGFDEELPGLWHMVERHAGLGRCNPSLLV